MIFLLKEMFGRMVEAKDASLIEHYYHPELILYANGHTWDYQHFHDWHAAIYATDIEYSIRYQDETFLEQGNKVAGRMFITVKTPNEPAREIEVILVVEYRDQKIYRLWELTWPDWSQMPVFERD